VAVVTGANRGLGKETARQLVTRGYRVVVAARSADAGREAAKEIGGESLVLDVADAASVEQAARELGERYGKIHVLVSNAGVALDGFDEEVAEKTLSVNVFGAMKVADALRPLLSDDAVVVMVSSGMGELTCVSRALRNEFERKDRSRERLGVLLRSFVTSVAKGTHVADGWPTSAYRVSKVGLNAFTRILARELSSTRIRVNAVCPGWVRTDMGGPAATRSVEEGAASVVWAATLGQDGPTGGFFRDGKAIGW
jgi:carbonyl reductase 1